MQFFNLLIEQEILSKPDVSPFQHLSDNKLYDLCKTKFQIDENRLNNAVASALNIESRSLKTLIPDPKLCSKYCDFDLQERRMVLLYEDDDHIGIVTDNPFNPHLQDFKKPVKLILTSSVDLNSYWGNIQADNGQPETLFYWVKSGIDKGASDIHGFRSSDGLTLKYRLHGQLYDAHTMDEAAADRLLRLTKLYAGIDIAQHRCPQEGRFDFTYKDINFDVRVSTLPTLYGEDFVLRLFAQSQQLQSLNDMGFCDAALTTLDHFANAKHGLALITGPTGSGKTTTLYGLAKVLIDQGNRNVVSIEDPIERGIDGVRQSQINIKAGYDFSNALKAILRQDPDVIIVGEIRDAATARLAVTAAHTGHLVLATLHTNDCQSSLLRLLDFSVDGFMLGHALLGISSQRLVPSLCPNCKTMQTSNNQNTRPSVFPSYQRSGCEHCFFTGICGRTVVTETLILNSNQALNEQTVENAVVSGDFHSFDDDILEKVGQGKIEYDAQLI